MTINNKKYLFVGYIFIILIEFLFRDYSYSYFEFFYNSFFLICGLSLIIKYWSGRESFYLVPIILGVIISTYLIIHGLTSITSEVLGGLQVVVGILVLISSFATFFLRDLFSRTLFNIDKRNEDSIALITDYVMFGLYMLLISNKMTLAIQNMDSGLLYLLLIAFILVSLYFVIDYLVTKFSKHLPIDVLNSLLFGLIGLSIYITFFSNISSSLVQNLNIIYVSFALFIAAKFMVEIFMLNNKR